MKNSGDKLKCEFCGEDVVKNEEPDDDLEFIINVNAISKDGFEKSIYKDKVVCIDCVMSMVESSEQINERLKRKREMENGEM